ncbi:hypothetical protein BpHYR1_050247 [Brachionus plicatilis]|uniref:Uncharacterized protein n=1 Tax=Brachionus plicatilis TaxID=10195 RepID=A0A3M7RJI6_BRAPC|nr:hypothetical protein BpHYR1_050247 [Brachionus plicatilis]
MMFVAYRNRIKFGKRMRNLNDINFELSWLAFLVQVLRKQSLFVVFSALKLTNILSNFYIHKTNANMLFSEQGPHSVKRKFLVEDYQVYYT